MKRNKKTRFRSCVPFSCLGAGIIMVGKIENISDFDFNCRGKKSFFGKVIAIIETVNQIKYTDKQIQRYYFTCKKYFENDIDGFKSKIMTILNAFKNSEYLFEVEDIENQFLFFCNKMTENVNVNVNIS